MISAREQRGFRCGCQLHRDKVAWKGVVGSHVPSLPAFYRVCSLPPTTGPTLTRDLLHCTRASIPPCPPLLATVLCPPHPQLFWGRNNYLFPCNGWGAGKRTIRVARVELCHSLSSAPLRARIPELLCRNTRQTNRRKSTDCPKPLTPSYQIEQWSRVALPVADPFSRLLLHPAFFSALPFQLTPELRDPPPPRLL